MDPMIAEETRRDPVEVENNSTKRMTQTTLAGGRVEATEHKIDERQIDEHVGEKDSVPVVVPLSNDASQRSLFSLKKVVRMGKSMTSVSFTAQDLQDLKKKLEDASTGKHELLQSLRLLQCYRLCLEDLRVSGLGGVVRILSMVHPKEEVQKAAGNMMQKWKRMVLRELFPLPRSANRSTDDVDETFGYNVSVARAAPEGCDVPPEELIRLEEEDALYEKMCRKRERIEEDPFCSSTGEEEESDSDMWSPSMERRRRAAKLLAARRKALGTDEEPSPDENKVNETNMVEPLAPAPKKRLSKAFQNLFAKGKADDARTDKPLKETIDLASCEEEAPCL